MKKTRRFERVFAARFILTRNSATGTGTVTILRQWPPIVLIVCVGLLGSVYIVSVERQVLRTHLASHGFYFLSLWLDEPGS
jgi:hypothetical protein